MDNFLNEGNKMEPRMEFNKEKELFEISGIARSENFYETFTTAFKWIYKYVENPNPETTLICKIQYCNTSSSKQIFEIIKALKKCNENGSIFKVIWEHEIDDDDMIFLGKSIEDILEIPFEFVGMDE